VSIIDYPMDEYGEGLSGNPLKPEPKTEFQRMQADIHQAAIAKGWWDNPRNHGEIIALIHSELSEALEVIRNGEPMSGKIPEFTELELELADVAIRLMDYAESRGIDLWSEIAAKAEYNKTRSYRHGGKRF
jgi:NTP pyrophosphatase (non-canonical NTP hydrolase)